MNGPPRPPPNAPPGMHGMPPRFAVPPMGFRMPPPGQRMPPPPFRHPPPMPPGLPPPRPFNMPPPGYMRPPQGMTLPFGNVYTTQAENAAVISAGPQLTTPPTTGNSSPVVTKSETPTTSVPPLQPPPMPTINLPGSAPPPKSSDSTTTTSSSSSSKDKKSSWTEHKAPDGRIYFYNNVTRQSSWDKPDELKSSAERLLSQCPWKEYKSESGKVYYHNVNTKESSWNIPGELAELKARLASDNKKNESDKSSASALDKAMAATLAAITVPEPAPVKKADSPAKPKPVKEKDPPPPKKEVKPLVFKDKKEAIEAFKEFLREKNISSDATWERSSRMLQNDHRFEVFNRISERKQAFHAYKVQRSKEEKEEARLKAKAAKEELEKFLMNNERMNGSIKYYRCDEYFQHMDVWKVVLESERRDIYEDVVFTLAKQEKEKNKTLRKRNMKVLSEILDSMTNITSMTTWSEAQQRLIENPKFAEDAELLNMDKEDALIVFAEHIKQLEDEDDEEKEKNKRWKKRQERKARDSFHNLLDELHEQGKLTSMSLWVELYPIISADVRFSNMFGTSGSNALDLFKFYVADLKSRFHDEKKIIKQILKEKNFEVQVSTTFRDFATVVCDDTRSATLDAGNVKLTFNALIEKAESRDKERQKEEARRMKKLEMNFRLELKSADVDAKSEWDEVRETLKDTSAFHAITVEAERIRIFKEYQQYLEEACGHRHSRAKKKNKKKDRRRSRSRSSYSSSDSSRHRRSRHSRSRSASSDDSEEEVRKRKKKSKKKKRSYSSSSEESYRSKKVYRKKKSKKSRSRSKSRSVSSPEKRRRSPIKKKDREIGEVSAEEGELSEDELEKKREILMKELQNVK